jgi:hypothetical protein
MSASFIGYHNLDTVKMKYTLNVYISNELINKNKGNFLI